MESLLYYQLCFVISAALSFIYICLWHDGINVYMTCLFIMLPIVCLGCIWMYWAPDLEVAIISNKLVYLAGCFFPLIATKAILSFCDLKSHKAATILAFGLSFLFFGFALTSDKPGPLYKSIDWVEVDGRIELYPEYGWMHTLIYAVMVLYVLIGVIALIYGMKNKMRASIKNMRIMLLGEVITMAVFFIYGFQKLAGSPAILYVSSQLVFLIVGYRSYYYNIDSSVMDTVISEGKLGYITFDTSRRLLGCNEVAEQYFPELKTARTDCLLDNMDGIKRTLSDCLDSLEKDSQPIETIVKSGSLFITVKAGITDTVGWKKIYRFILEDDTDHMELIRMLSKEKAEAEHVSQLVSETFHRYVDPNIADTLLKNENSTFGTEQNIAVLFADIRGFTTYSEERSPKEVITLLNIILEAATSCIMSNNGVVDKIIGDCVMAFWTDPEHPEESACLACKAAFEIQQSMKQLEPEIKAQFGTALHLGIGINYGKAIVGNIGTTRRSDYTVIGDAVNVASRLEGLAGPGEILVTEDTAKAVGDRGSFTVFNNDFKLKGRSNTTVILRLEDVR